ncbi:MAG TPA: hypothetical protein VK348_15135, partial [Planctomycetota bacterium]|nr:hypothetical protein [Planctomycetota bacterium]
MLAVLAWLFWPVTDATLELAAAVTPDESAPTAIAAALPQSVLLREDPEADIPAAAPAPDLEHPYPFTLSVRVIDGFGLPVEGALVFAAPPQSGFGLWPVPSSASGHVQLRWQARVQRMQLTIAVLANGVLQPMRRLDLETGTQHQLTLAAMGRKQDEAALAQAQNRELARRRQRVEELRRQEGNPAWNNEPRRGRLRRRDELDVLCGRSLLLFREFECTACHTPSRIAVYDVLRRAADLQPGLHPGSLFTDLREHTPSAAELQKRQHALVQNDSDPAQRARRAIANRAVVSGRVVLADGKPATEVPVAWLGEGGMVNQRTATDGDGLFQLAPVQAGSVELCAGGGDGGNASTLLVASTMGTTWNAELAAASVVRGSATDDTGKPLAGWRVEFESEGSSWADFAPTHDDGTFVLPAIPLRGRCLLWPADPDLALPVMASGIALPDGEPVQLRLDPAVPTRSRLRVHPSLPAGYERAPVEVRVVQQDTGRVAPLTRTGYDEAFALEGLCPGWYLVEIGAPMLGWITAGPVCLDGRGLWDLGNVALPAPGRMHLRIRDGVLSPLQAPHHCYRRTAAVDLQEDYRL